MSNACTPPAAVVAERPVIVPAALAAVETEAAMRGRHCDAIGFHPLPTPFDAVASVRLVTASGKVVLKSAPWTRDCEYRSGQIVHDPKAYYQWHDRAVGGVVDRPRPVTAKYRVTVCAMKDRGESLAGPNYRTDPPDTLAVFVSVDDNQRFNTVLFAEGVLGLGHLLRILSPLLRLR